MTAAPAVSMKRIDDTPLDELIRERAIWDTAIKIMRERGEQPHPTLCDALLVYDAVIARRLRQTEGDALPPDQRLPDTNHFEEAAA